MTKKDLISFGFKELPHFTIMHSLTYDVGRNRHISIGGLRTPNEIVFLCQVDPGNDKNITDLICLHNYDHDGYITWDKMNHLLNYFN